MKVEDSRVLLFVILRSQKQLKLTAGNMMDLSLESFTRVRCIRFTVECFSLDQITAAFRANHSVFEAFLCGKIFGCCNMCVCTFMYTYKCTYKHISLSLLQGSTITDYEGFGIIFVGAVGDEINVDSSILSFYSRQ